MSTIKIDPDSQEFKETFEKTVKFTDKVMKQILELQTKNAENTSK